jgi:alkanesulfonate monooxygenase SsuD/methylene tetrahydromethanopterin reductase-like flavin-dependent oxidoreductase (luciferase family)
VVATVRARVGFYLSTPSYRRVFDLHDWGDLADKAAVLSKSQRWEELAAMVPDDVLHTVATIGTHETIVDRLLDRYDDRVDKIEFSIPINGPADAEVFSSMLTRLHSGSSGGSND